MKCKYVLLNATLIKDILNYKYDDFEIKKIGFNRWFVKSGEIGIGIFDKKSLTFLRELLWHRGFIKRRNHDESDND